jgi:hypothetical protein
MNDGKKAGTLQKLKRKTSVDDAERRRIEDDAKRADWDAAMLASGNGFKLTNEEADLVYRLLGNAFTHSTDETVRREIGDEIDVRTAANLYMRMFEAMTNREPG